MIVSIVTQHFPPEIPATGRRAHDLAASLARAGHHVTVIAGRPNHPASFERSFCQAWAARETEPEGYKVLRVPVFRSAEAQPLMRLLNYASFLLAAVLKGITQPRPDVVVAISPLPAGLAALVLHGWHRAPLVYDLQDVWPDSARAVGVLREGRTLRVLRSLEKALYRHCARVVVISRGFRDYLVKMGVDAAKIDVIENGVELDLFAGAAPELCLRDSHGLRERFVVGYVGNIGLAQGLDTLFAAAHHLRREPAAFLLVGDGVERQRLEWRAREEGLANVRFLPGVPRPRVAGVLAACDALLVMLRDDPLFEITIPSKVYEYMAAGKPILCSVNGETAELVRQAGCGIALPAADGAALASGVRKLMSDRAGARSLGAAGACWVSQHANRPELMSAYAQVLREVAEQARGLAPGRSPVNVEAAS
jgi:putative colanic acid biosynthesis glycosyltransferase WcaI